MRSPLRSSADREPNRDEMIGRAFRGFMSTHSQTRSAHTGQRTSPRAVSNVGSGLRRALNELGEEAERRLLFKNAKLVDNSYPRHRLLLQRARATRPALPSAAEAPPDVHVQE